MDPSTPSISIADLVAGTRDLAVPFPNGFSLALSYNPQAVTSRVIDVKSQDPDVLAEGVCKVVTAWNLTDGAGAVPVGPANVNDVASRVPTVLLVAVLQAVLADITPNPTSATS